MALKVDAVYRRRAAVRRRSLDTGSRRVFAGRMAKKRRMSTVTLASGLAFVLTFFAALSAETGVAADLLGTLCLLSIAVLLTSIAIDVRRGRYWALSVLVFVGAVATFLVLLVSAVAQGVCCG
ncbi:MAG: hypothetical protein QOH16_2184 [Gaiellaceae bacterium]|nr:hypothetical protein [Gaiellaceae bacterium]